MYIKGIGTRVSSVLAPRCPVYLSGLDTRGPPLAFAGALLGEWRSLAFALALESFTCSAGVATLHHQFSLLPRELCLGAEGLALHHLPRGVV